MFFTFDTFTMESVGLLGIFAMLTFGIFTFPMGSMGLMIRLFSTFTFQNIGCLDMGGLIGIFTMNESGVRV